VGLAPGTRLGAYEILTLLGRGGMGEVYKARDHRLGRDVAVKIVRADHPGDAGLAARLEQEARTAASLSHPNIVAVFDVGTHEGAPYVVSELLEGETLRARLAAGPLAFRKAIDYASELANGLAAAHDRGFVHRDLKPENIFLTREGHAKILDFGLAKSSEPPTTAVTETATVLQTLPGVVIGTVGYMSPEQVSAAAVDHRTDIFSLGAVLDEMLTGRPTFKRQTDAQTMAAILEHDPPAASSTNPAIPSSLDRIVRRCLEKTPVARFQSASDLAFALSTVEASGSQPTLPRRLTVERSSRMWMAGVAVVSALLGALVMWVAPHRTMERATVASKHFTIDLRSMPISESTMPLALSPDGTKVVVSLGSYQGAQLYLRSLDRPELRPIAGTLDAFNPFFSPDGEWVGFFTSNDLRKAPVSGGAVTTICHTASLLRGSASWGTNDTIYFAPYSSNVILSVRSTGGEPTPVTTLASGEVSHQFPTLLPGDRAILYTVTYGDPKAQSGANFLRSTRVVTRSLESGEQRTLIEGASFARYLPSGEILYVKAESLFVAPFDVQRLAVSGPPVAVSEDVAVSGDGAAVLAMASDGTLIYLPRSTTEQRSLEWVDRQGASVPAGFGERSFETPRLSPDGSRIATLAREKGQADVWIQERNGALSRLTFDGVQTGLVWTPPGTAITFSTLVNGKGTIVVQDVDGARASHVVFSSARGVWPGSWSRDGRTLAFMESVNGGDVNVMRLGDTQAMPFVSSPATEWGARLSPDDRWMAYTSNESGHWDVYVKPFPGPGARRQISTDGGAEAVWARSGRELFYRNGSKLMAVDIQTEPAFAAGAPHVVFDGTFAAGQPGLPGYDVSLDGQRFLMIKLGDAEAGQRSIHVVLNWANQLRGRATAR
jgi:eukaryotic-like serine/threonine-protein kinase